VAGERTPLGASSHAVGRVAFGCEQLGGFEWGAVDPAEVAAAIESAIAAGVTLFDTADCYGRGESERRLGRILAPHREHVLIATKFGVRFSSSGAVWYDSSGEWALQAVDQSLRRLQTEVIDLLQMHYWDGVTPLTDLFDVLERLRERGKIRMYGVSNLPLQMLPADGFPGLVSASLEYSLAERSQERAAQQLSAAGLTFLAYGCLGQGILTGKYAVGVRFAPGDRRARPQYRNFHGERLVRNARIVEVLKREATRLGAHASQLAIAWVLRTIPGSVALVGIKRPEQLLDALQAQRLELTAETLSALDAASAVLETTDDAHA
jgi:aryl-alcohol dehydrogenase-like predicted oxidoreductase